MGTAPDLDWKLDCQPVNLVAKSILELSGKTGPTFHLGHPRPRGWRECVLWMRMYGYEIRLVPYHAWLRQLDAETAPAAADSGAHPLRALRSFFLTRHLDAHGLTLPELFEESRRTIASSSRTLATVARQGVMCPALDAALLDTYFTRFRKDGVLPPPPAESAPRVAKAQFDSPSTLLAEMLGTSVGQIRILDSGSEHSIVSELTAWRSGRTTGLFRAEASLPSGSTRDMRLKSKAEDVDVIAAGAALAHLVDPAVGRAYAKWSDRIGFTGVTCPRDRDLQSEGSAIPPSCAGADWSDRRHTDIDLGDGSRGTRRDHAAETVDAPQQWKERTSRPLWTGWRRFKPSGTGARASYASSRGSASSRVPPACRR